MSDDKNMDSESNGLRATGNFIHNFIQEDLQGDLNKVHTRFPPEPNGYLHIRQMDLACPI